MRPIPPFGFTGATLLLLLLFGLGFSWYFQVSWLAVAERIGAVEPASPGSACATKTAKTAATAKSRPAAATKSW
jgi:hypothetical protein